ncbi:chromate efflux transporter [Acidovorax lacteus]|uniref:Chromate efflux transporter n=1 Tax=Acidovorax lacteus TaxID=1924988 RepID=A0ABP8L264_9BURK
MTDPSSSDTRNTDAHDRSAWAVFCVFLRLGLTAFGGPVAHLGYFRAELVERRRWLDERAYANLVALCQFMPGPASSQVGMALGLMRAGYAGALAAWVGFTLPSAVLLALLGMGLATGMVNLPAGMVQGLKLAAVAVVAQAVWGMGRSLCEGRERITLMALSAAATLCWPGAMVQLGTLALAAFYGMARWGRHVPAQPPGTAHPLTTLSRRAGLVWLLLGVALLLVLPLAAQAAPGSLWAVADAFYRAGALVFGGGHVVLPLLQAEVVDGGWLGADTFLAGYGAAQAVPGPLFTFATFIGAALPAGQGGWLGALVCTVAIFAAGFCWVLGALPFWQRLQHRPGARAALSGVNAAVVGLLLAALYDPVVTSAIHAPRDVALALAAFVALLHWKAPPWAVVLACALAGGLLGAA